MAAAKACEISLTRPETEIFIDLWEANPCLWKPSDEKYRNKLSRYTF